MAADLLTQVWARPDDRLELTPGKWETLIGQARRGNLLARLGQHHADREWMAQLPGGPRVHLQSAMKLADRQRHEVRWEVDCLARALVPLGHPVILLKGAAYLMTDLPGSRGRLFADIDIMVPQSNVTDAEAALFGAGWISEERDDYNQRYYRQWMHEVPPLRHVQRNTVIDLHHTITPPTSRFCVSGQALLERALPLKDWPGLFVLAPEDMVLHSAVHLFQEGEFHHGLRDLLDLNDMLGHWGSHPRFWSVLLDRSDELGLQIPLYHALSHLRRLLGTKPPEELMDRVQRMGPNPLSRAFMAWALGLALKPFHPSVDTRLGGLARWLLYLRSHLLRMPLRLVIPHLVRKAWMRRFPDQSAHSANPIKDR
jgi:hypothetical protein